MIKLKYHHGQSWLMSDGEIRKLIDEGFTFLDFPKSGSDILKDFDNHGVLGAEKKWGIESALREGKPVRKSMRAKFGL